MSLGEEIARTGQQYFSGHKKIKIFSKIFSQVKEVVVRRSHFEHIPLPGMVLTQTDRYHQHFSQGH